MVSQGEQAGSGGRVPEETNARARSSPDGGSERQTGTPIVETAAHTMRCCCEGKATPCNRPLGGSNALAGGVMTEGSEQGPVYELLRACPAVPLTTEGRRLESAEMSPGLQVRIDGDQDGQLLVSAVGSSPVHTYRYLVNRDDLALAIREPSFLPREGQAPTASSNTAGAPD